MTKIKTYLKKQIEQLVWDVVNKWGHKEIIKSSINFFMADLNSRLERILAKIEETDSNGVTKDRRKQFRKEKVRHHIKSEIENTIWEILGSWVPKKEVMTKIKEVSSEIDKRVEKILGNLDFENLRFDRRAKDRRHTGDRRELVNKPYTDVDLNPTEILSAKLQVKSYDLDMYGHVNNAAYLNYLEFARFEYIKQLGFNPSKNTLRFLVIKAVVNFKSAAHLDDELVIIGNIMKVGKSSLTVHQQCFNVVSKTLILDAEIALAYVGARNKLSEIPENLRTAFEPFIKKPTKTLKTSKQA